MAKNSFPMKASGGLLGKVVWLAVGVALLMLIVHNPSEAARWASELFTFAGQVVDGIAHFLQSLFG